MRCSFGRFELDTGKRSLLADGQPQPVGARAFDLLVALIERSDRVVGSEELLDLVWPGLVVEENNLRQQIAALRRALGASSIMTVPGRGYRFASPETVDRSASASAIATTPDRNGAVERHGQQPSIAVLPFAALSDDPMIGLLADGLVEDIIALLARVAGFLLISSSSSFEFRERRESLASIAQRLDVRYVVEGSVRPVGDDVRVSTRLVEASSGRVLWSGGFERARGVAEDLQEAIARGIMVELEPELTRAQVDVIRRHRSTDLDAWSSFHQATAQLARNGWTPAALGEARRQLSLACTLDPTFALAHAQFALLTALGINTGLIEPGAAVIGEARTAAEHALALDDQDSRVLGYAGCALVDLGELDRGEIVLQQALARDPSNAQAHVALGATHAMRGDWDSGIRVMRHGMRISPRDRRLGFWGWALGLFLLRAGRTDDALMEARTSAARDSRLHLSHVLQALALLTLGRRDEARLAYAHASRLMPSMKPQDAARSHGEWAVAMIEQLVH